MDLAQGGYNLYTPFAAPPLVDSISYSSSWVARIGYALGIAEQAQAL